MPLPFLGWGMPPGSPGVAIRPSRVRHGACSHDNHRGLCPQPPRERTLQAAVPDAGGTRRAEATRIRVLPGLAEPSPVRWRRRRVWAMRHRPDSPEGTSPFAERLGLRSRPSRPQGAASCREATRRSFTSQEGVPRRLERVPTAAPGLRLSRDGLRPRRLRKGRSLCGSCVGASSAPRRRRARAERDSPHVSRSAGDNGRVTTRGWRPLAKRGAAHGHVG